MSIPDWIGTIGVSLLLVAFGLNLLNVISSKSYIYLYLNFFGAALAGFASVLIHYIPFVVLEAVWCLVTLVAIRAKYIENLKN